MIFLLTVIIATGCISPGSDQNPALLTASPSITAAVSSAEVPGFSNTSTPESALATSTPVSIEFGPAPVTAEVTLHANCRSGPGTQYQIVTGYAIGERVGLVGISPDGAWWVVRMDGNGGFCWIWGQLLALDDRSHDLPVYPVPPTPMVAAAGAGDPDYESTLLNLINQERSNIGVAPVTSDARLVTAARSHSTDMATNNFFDHTGTGGTSFGQRITAQGYLYSSANEIIYANGEPQQCLWDWMQNIPYREILLDPTYTQVGIGVFRDPDSTNRVYVTADFVTP
jgi:uncharacterized protein YkwD